MIFNQMVHSFVKEALHILAPALFLMNTTSSIFQKSVILLREILQKVMLRFYTSFRIHSTAFIQGLFVKLEHIPSTTASIESPPCLRNIFNGTLQKSNATVQTFSKYSIFYCFQWILHRLRELSYWSTSVLFQVTFLQKGHVNLTEVAFARVFV